MILESKAPAKVNLGLHVLRKRADGYHDIETVFLPVPWYDHLRAEPADGFTFTCSDPRLPTDASNLCVCAANRLMAFSETRGGSKMGAALHLEKHLPFGAGLGGGSSDAAQTLILLNALWQLGLTAETLHEIAADLGSDVPFFLKGRPAFASGRGELLEPLVIDNSGTPYPFPYAIMLVVPPVEVSTVDAYRRVVPFDGHRPDIRAIVQSNDLVLWRSELVNDFEPSVFAAYPVIKEVKGKLYAEGADYAAMSGSGSAVYGIFEDPERVDAAVRAFEALHVRVWRG